MLDELERRDLPLKFRLKGHLEKDRKYQKFSIIVDFENRELTLETPDLRRDLARAARAAGLVSLFTGEAEKRQFHEFIDHHLERGQQNVLAIAFDNNVVVRHVPHLVADYLATRWNGHDFPYFFLISAMIAEEFNWQSDSKNKGTSVHENLIELAVQKPLIQYPLVGKRHDVQNQKEERLLRSRLGNIRDARGRRGSKGKWEIKSLLQEHPTILIKSDNLLAFPRLHSVEEVKSGARADQIIRLDYEFFNRNTSVNMIVISEDKSFTTSLQALGMEALYLEPPSDFRALLTRNINERHVAGFITELLVISPYLEIDPFMSRDVAPTAQLDKLVLAADWIGKSPEEEQEGILRGCFASRPSQLFRISASY